MKLVTYSIPPRLGDKRVGVLTDDTVVDLRDACAALLQSRGGAHSAPAVAAAVTQDMTAFLAGAQWAMELAKDALAYTRDRGQETRIPLADTRLHAPLVPTTHREFSVFEGHLVSGGRTLPDIWYELPLYWKGNTNSVIGPDEIIPFPGYTDMIDYELEIAAVIGKPGINIDVQNAMDHIAGFTIFNDVSARDIQLKEMTFFMGPAKGKDFCNVFGPSIVTRDEVDPDDLDVTIRLNGELLTESSTRGMQHTWDKIVSYASQGEWLQPGDVLTSGTVNGCCGLEHWKHPESGPILQPGDVVELEVEGLGVLRNTYGERDKAYIDYTNKGSRIPR